MSNLQTPLPTDIWISASWDNYLNMLEAPTLKKAKGYYYNGHMRVEMPLLGMIMLPRTR